MCTAAHSKRSQGALRPDRRTPVTAGATHATPAHSLIRRGHDRAIESALVLGPVEQVGAINVESVPPRIGPLTGLILAASPFRYRKVTEVLLKYCCAFGEIAMTAGLGCWMVAIGMPMKCSARQHEQLWFH